MALARSLGEQRHGVHDDRARVCRLSGLAGHYDVVVLVDVPPAIQLDRLTLLRGMPAEQASARIVAQAARDQRLAIADLVIDNSGPLAALDRQVAEVWAELCRRAQMQPQ